MTAQCLAIIVVHGSVGDDVPDRSSEIVDNLGGQRLIEKDTTPVENGDVMFVDDLSELNLIGSNVLLTADNQAPIFRAIALEDALKAL